jgi:oleate hydratase
LMKTSSKSRLVRRGQRINAPRFGLTEKHILAIERLGLEPEAILGRSNISDQFDPSFLETDFWSMWCTTFAFQPWHSAVEFKRYLVRFVHMVSGFNTLSGIMRTAYNQYDSMVRPLQKWLEEHGVRSEFNTSVTNLGFCHDAEGFTVERIVCVRDGHKDEIRVSNGDSVIVTLGSMTAAPILKDKCDCGSWALWEKIADGHPQFGHPANFSDHIDESKWVSFTTTLHDPTFFNHVTGLTGNIPERAALLLSLKVTGSRRSYYLTSHISSDHRTTLRRQCLLGVRPLR